MTSTHYDQDVVILVHFVTFIALQSQSGYKTVQHVVIKNYFVNHSSPSRGRYVPSAGYPVSLFFHNMRQPHLLQQEGPFFPEGRITRRGLNQSRDR